MRSLAEQLSPSESSAALCRARRLVGEMLAAPNRPADAVNPWCRLCRDWIGNVAGGGDGEGDPDGCHGFGGAARPQCWRMAAAGGGDTDPETGELVDAPSELSDAEHPAAAGFPRPATPGHEADPAVSPRRGAAVDDDAMGDPVHRS